MEEQVAVSIIEHFADANGVCVCPGCSESQGCIVPELVRSVTAINVVERRRGHSWTLPVAQVDMGQIHELEDAKKSLTEFAAQLKKP